MILGNIILFALATVGMSHIIVDGKIFMPVKKWLNKWLPSSIYQLFDCYQCSGTWCGFVCGSIILSNNFLVIFLCGMAGSFLAVVAASFLNFMEAQTLINIGDDDER